MQATMTVRGSASLGTAGGLEQSDSADLHFIGLRRAVYGGRSDLRANSLKPLLCVAR